MAAMELSAPAPVNGILTPSPAEEEEFYTQILELRDTVLAGKHPHYTLPLAAIKQLEAALIVPDAQDADGQLVEAGNAQVNGQHFATNHIQSQASPSFPAYGTLPGLQNGTACAAKPATAGGLDPIFLEKSDSLVRAEGQLKRQRIERDLLEQVDKRKSTGGKDAGVEAVSHLDVDAILREALVRVPPVSGLKPSKAASDTSFDENDYYSSQVQSEWSSPESSSKGSDRVADAFNADFEPLEEPVCDAPKATASKRAVSGKGKQPAVPHVSGQWFDYGPPPDDAYNVQGEDDEDYTPPDAGTFDTRHEDGAATGTQQATPPDDNSDYEPGEITAESNIPTPLHQAQRPGQPSPQVPIIRNHLTHIAAPQPNRVSPLAVAKGPSIELELVNGRPEIVHKSQQGQPIHSRASTASPSGPGNGPSKKHRRNKNKRKRDREDLSGYGRGKRRRDRQGAQSPTSPVQQEPYIKREPVSPPPFANVLEPEPYGQPIDVDEPRQAQPATYVPYEPQPPQQPRYVQVPSSGLRYEQTQPPPQPVRVASPAAYRPVPRDTQDLRRVASLHYAQRPASPPQRMYSPVGPYQARATSMAYGAPPPQMQEVRYAEELPQPAVQYARAERHESPLRLQEYREPVDGREASPAPMPTPAAAPRRIITDQYGNKYYAVEPALESRASVAPVARSVQPEMGYERAPSRMSVAYAQPLPAQSVRYEPVEMAPPRPPIRRQVAQEQPMEYIDANGYRVRAYTRAPEPVQYVERPTSPVFQQTPRYEQMPPPPAPPAREPTSPVYAPDPRSYSARPEEPPAIVQNQQGYRQASVAPIQYARQDMPPPPPVRALSVVPGYEPVQQRTYSYAPQPSNSYIPQQAVRYMDAHSMPPPPPVARAVSVAPGHEYAQPVQQRSYSYAPAPQENVRYIQLDQYGREIQPPR